MKILLTGFEAFGNSSTNPSADVLALIKRYNVVTKILPVSYEQSPKILEDEIRNTRPDVVICLGYAALRKWITPELCAINYRYAPIPDNDGNVQKGTAIDENGQEAFFTTLPIHSITEHLLRNGYPAHISVSAGSYICNAVYYSLLKNQKKYIYNGLFVHVPSTNILTLNQLADAINCLLDFVMKDSE